MSTVPQAVTDMYTPPNWSDQPALYAITFRTTGTEQQTDYNPFALTANTTLDLPGSRAGYNSETQMSMLVFDALRRAQHRQYAVVTQHPLQTGFNISDHVVMQPAQITLEVGMSDAIQSYSLAGYTPMWTMNPSKSVSKTVITQHKIDTTAPEPFKLWVPGIPPGSGNFTSDILQGLS
jgi:hypothetical protein